MRLAIAGLMLLSAVPATTSSPNSHAVVFAQAAGDDSSAGSGPSSTDTRQRPRRQVRPRPLHPARLRGTHAAASATLQPGQQAEADVAFEVPAGMHAFAIRWSPRGFWGNQLPGAQIVLLPG